MVIEAVANRIMSDPRFANNKVMQNAFNMYRSGNMEQLGQYTKNVCQENRMDINNLVSQAQNILGRM